MYVGAAVHVPIVEVHRGNVWIPRVDDRANPTREEAVWSRPEVLSARRHLLGEGRLQISSNDLHATDVELAHTQTAKAHPQSPTLRGCGRC